MVMGSAYRQVWGVASLALFAIYGLVGTSRADGTLSPLLDEAAQAQSVAVSEPLPVDPLDEMPAADDACMQELRRCCCCPNWTHYAIFDLLFLQRSNQIGNQPLVYNSDTNTPVMTAQDLYPSTATGMRLFYGELFTDSLGWEVGYTGIYGMFGQATATGNGNLEAPSPLGPIVGNFNGADTATATYWSTLNMAEFNVFCYDCCEECGPTWCPLTNCKRNCHCINWMAGFVWAGLNEQANYTMSCCNDPVETSSYNVRSGTNYYGGQIGMRGRREWQRWAVEGWWKTALCGTNSYQSAGPITDSVSPYQVRGPESATASGVGFIGSLNGTLIYRLTQYWGVRAGYNLYWLTNSALAPTQWDFSNTATSGTGINDNGGIFLHGANLGVERRW